MAMNGIFPVLQVNCSFTINWQGMIRPCVMQSMPQVNVFDKGFLQGWETISNETKKDTYQ